MREGSTHGWSHLTAERKRTLIESILRRGTTEGPLHAELDITDRCNVACYFCNQQDTRSKLQLPCQRVIRLVDEMADRGLASVRLSGGGDPLHHKEILAILDHLAHRGVVVDNLTTNAVAMDGEVVERLVRHEAREVNVSLNAADGQDYQRMMAVKPALFEKAVANTRMLVKRRDTSKWPLVSVQFLLDRTNGARAVEMYRLAESLGCDRVILSAVQQIAADRLDPRELLSAKDADRLLPHFVQLFQIADPSRLEINLSSRGLGEMVGAAMQEADWESVNTFPMAPSFREEDGGCFFAWYSTAVTGNGNVYPCCQLIRPDQAPLGNVLQEGMDEVWTGKRYSELRGEMGEALLEGADKIHPAGRFRVLQDVCHRPGLCWLKNLYFRADDGFYGELSAALRKQRQRKVRFDRLARWPRGLVGRMPFLRPLYDRFRNSTRPLRRWLHRNLGLPLSETG